MNFPKFFKKAIKGVVGGRYINSRGEPDEFILKGDPSTVDADGVTVEVHNEEAEKYFIKSNKTAIQKGFLVEISDYTMTLDTINGVSDGYLKDLLKEPFTKIRNRVEQFTSPVPISRLLEIATKENKPVKTVSMIKEILAKFDDTRTIKSISSGNITTGGTK